jgi:hypothetical protein
MPEADARQDSGRQAQPDDPEAADDDDPPEQRAQW